MYATYNIHVKTQNLEFIQVFKSRQEAIDHLKKDAENHIARFKNMNRWITKKSEISRQGLQEPDGYYLKLSQKHSNRAVAYEVKTIVRRGYIYNSNIKEVVKAYVYGVIELPHESINSQYRLKPVHMQTLNELKAYSLSVTALGPEKMELKDNNNIDSHINELKACLLSRRAKMGHI